MTYEEFWKGSPYLAVAYRKAEQKRRETKNTYLWLQGKYVLDAFTCVMSAAFGKKGKKPISYPKEPYRITPLTEEEKKEQAEKARNKFVANLNAWKAAWDRQNG